MCQNVQRVVVQFFTWFVCVHMKFNSIQFIQFTILSLITKAWKTQLSFLFFWSLGGWHFHFCLTHRRRQFGLSRVGASFCSPSLRSRWCGIPNSLVMFTSPIVQDICASQISQLSTCGVSSSLSIQAVLITKLRMLWATRRRLREPWGKYWNKLIKAEIAGWAGGLKGAT